jgi:hypothetical protein
MFHSSQTRGGQRPPRRPLVNCRVLAAVAAVLKYRRESWLSRGAFQRLWLASGNQICRAPYAIPENAFEDDPVSQIRSLIFSSVFHVPNPLGPRKSPGHERCLRIPTRQPRPMLPKPQFSRENSILPESVFSLRKPHGDCAGQTNFARGRRGARKLSAGPREMPPNMRRGAVRGT